MASSAAEKMGPLLYEESVRVDFKPSNAPLDLFGFHAIMYDLNFCVLEIYNVMLLLTGYLGAVLLNVLNYP